MVRKLRLLIKLLRQITKDITPIIMQHEQQMHLWEHILIRKKTPE